MTIDIASLTKDVPANTFYMESGMFSELDENGNVVWLSDGEREFWFTFDNRGNEIKLESIDGSWMIREYNDSNQITKTLNDEGIEHRYWYNPDGSLKRVQEYIRYVP